MYVPVDDMVIVRAIVNLIPDDIGRLKVANRRYELIHRSVEISFLIQMIPIDLV